MFLWLHLQTSHEQVEEIRWKVWPSWRENKSATQSVCREGGWNLGEWVDFSLEFHLNR